MGEGEGEARRWPREPDFPPGLFRGTARYYARYRPAYPRELLDHLLRRARLTGSGRLLDLACGTGEVALPLAPHFERVHAVDQEPEMVDAGRAKADAAGLSNVTWAVGRAEDVDVPPGSLELVTIGNAFHRLNRRRIAQLSRGWLRPGGGIAVLNGSGLWSGREDWQRAAVEVIDKWKARGTGQPRPRAGAGPGDDETHVEALRAAGFGQIEEHDFPTPHTWAFDDFIGFLYSTGAASKARFGDAIDAFEADLRRALPAREPGDRYHETIRFHYILARRS